jgi:nitrate reductase delta subunit
MTRATNQQELCGQFAAFLRYPTADLASRMAGCLERLQSSHPEVAARLQPFADFLATSEPSRVEEVFTATFELQPLCHPYIGYQLCGESQQRTLFLLELKRLYRAHGFTGGGELPDHLGQVLGFLATAEDEAVRAELINDGLRPALDKLLAGFDDPQHPYRALLCALQVYLEATGIAGAKEVAQ